MSKSQFKKDHLRFVTGATEGQTWGRLGTTQWYCRDMHIGDGKFIGSWEHLPTGKIFYTRDSALAFDKEVQNK